MTIHPVVELKVGPYDENKHDHRVCEMNQDAHVFERLNVGTVGLSNHLRNGIARCGTPAGLDADIVALWSDMLSIVHPDEYASNHPDIQKWHRAFLAVLKKISKGQRLMPLARHVAVGAGLTYPAPTGVSREYLDGLEVPGGHLGYDALFEKAIANACAEWRVVAAGLFGHDSQYVTCLGVVPGRFLNNLITPACSR